MLGRVFDALGNPIDGLGPVKTSERKRVEIKAPGWVSGEQLGVARNRVVSVMDCPIKLGSVRVQIVSNKHNIYVAVPC